MSEDCELAESFGEPAELPEHNGRPVRRIQVERGEVVIVESSPVPLDNEFIEMVIGDAVEQMPADIKGRITEETTIVVAIGDKLAFTGVEIGFADEAGDEIDIADSDPTDEPTILTLPACDDTTPPNNAA